MSRTLDVAFFQCPICGKAPYVKTFNLNYGVAYCKGTLLKRHPLIQVKTGYCNPSKLFKTFMGKSNEKADIKANEWLEENPGIEIIDVRYQQARYSDHSICILYKEE